MPASAIKADNFLSVRSVVDMGIQWLPKSAYSRAILALVYLGFAAGLYATAAIFIHGPAILDATDYIPWGIQISTYVFFVLTSTGLCFVSSLGHVFGIRAYEAISKRAVFLAIVALISGFVALAPDLGRPENMVFFVLTPNFSSLLWWMGFLYSIYLVFMAAEFVSIHKGAMDWAKMMGIGGLVAAVSAHSTLGGVFGVVMARPFYFGAFMPLYFLLTAFLSGLAVISLASIVTPWITREQPAPEAATVADNLRKLLALVLGISLVFTAWKMLVGLYGPADVYQETYNHVVGSRVWQAEITLGLVIPFALVLAAPYVKSKAIPFLLAASCLILAGLFIGRLDMVVSGQILPVKALRDAALAAYVPGPAEVLSIMGAIAFCGLLYFSGERFLRLGSAPPPHSQPRESPADEPTAGMAV